MCVKQMVTDLAEERLPKRRSLPLEVGLERETRVELATLCLGSTGWARRISSVVDHLPPRQRVTAARYDDSPPMLYIALITAARSYLAIAVATPDRVQLSCRTPTLARPDPSSDISPARHVQPRSFR